MGYFQIQIPSKILMFNLLMQYILSNYLELNSYVILVEYDQIVIPLLYIQDTMLMKFLPSISKADFMKIHVNLIFIYRFCSKPKNKLDFEYLPN